MMNYVALLGWPYQAGLIFIHSVGLGYVIESLFEEGLELIVAFIWRKWYLISFYCIPDIWKSFG